MKVYIIFGGKSCNDGRNIESIWSNYEEAKAENQRLNAEDPWNLYNIEEFEVN